MRTHLALLASTALLLPTAVLTAPAEAAPTMTQDTITNCQKSQHGTTVRIKIRNLVGPKTRVRVSHRNGEGNFFNPKVRRAQSVVIGVNFANAARYEPSFRVKDGFVKVQTVFKLKNGNSITLNCSNQ